MIHTRIKSNCKLWLSLWALGIVNSIFASEHSYIALSIEQGLSQATINSIAQDHKGYIWIGTQDGLNRYDGYKILQFHHNPNDPASLSHSFINKVVVDEKGHIWILTASGVDRYDAETESFIRYTDKRFNRDFFDRLFLWSMQNGFDNSLWITTANGLLKFDKGTMKYRHFPSGEEFWVNGKKLL